MSKQKIVEAALAGDDEALRAAVAEHRQREAETAAWWESQRAEVVGKEFFCWSQQERRTVAELVNVRRQPILGTSFDIRDTLGDMWEIAPINPPEANDGMPFSVVDPDRRKWADGRLEAMADYEARRAEMGPPPKPNLRGPEDTAIVYQFWRYHVRGEGECESLEEAEARAAADAEYNEAAPAWITQGDKVLRDFTAAPPSGGQEET